jgi:hypothetical protein
MYMDYISEYNKYKKRYLKLKNSNKRKYLNHSGGYFDINELSYKENIFDEVLDKDPIDEIKYIAGPVTMTILRGPKPSNKIIYLIGDVHKYTTAGFECVKKDDSLMGRVWEYASSYIWDPDEDKNHTIYYPEYMLRLLKNNKDKQFDIFIELPYHHTKHGSRMVPGMIENINKLFDFCFRYLYNKEECIKNFPNARFHAMDIRKYSESLYSDGKDNIKLLTSLIELLKNIPKDDYELLTLISNIYESILYIQKYMTKKINNKIIYELKYNLRMLSEHGTKPERTWLGDGPPITRKEHYEKIYNGLIDGYNSIEQAYIHIKSIRGREKITKIDINKFINSYKLYYDNIVPTFGYLDHDMIKYLNHYYWELNNLYDMQIKIDPLYIEFIKDYISNEHYIYNDIYERMWTFIESSDKLKRNFSALREQLSEQYEQYIIDYYSKYTENLLTTDLNELVSNIVKDNIIHIGEESEKGIKDFIQFLWGYEVMIMDIYVLGRLFKPYVENSIIIAGNAHIENYLDILQHIGCEIIFNKQSYLEDPDYLKKEVLRKPEEYSSKCIKIDDQYKFIKDLKLPNSNNN